MRIYGDLFQIEGGFLTMMDFKLEYGDVYLTYSWNEDGTPYDMDDNFYVPVASFIDENCQVWEIIENLATIMMYTGANTSFWEDND